MAYYVERGFMSKYIFRLVLLLVLAAASAYGPAGSPQTIQAVNTDVVRCTDFNDAKIADPAAAAPEADQVGHDLEPYHILASVPRIKATLPQIIPNDHPSDWRMLTRPGSPFAVFYLETAGSIHRIVDTAPAGAPQTVEHNYDEDHDQVPDFAERIHHCAQIIYERYRAYYGDDDLAWMNIDYVDATGTSQNGSFYPITIRDEGQKGTVQPILNIAVTNSPADTFMRIESNEPSVGPARFSRDTPPWLYPELESTLYHEMAHVYQGLNKNMFAAADWMDNWIYEGTAVYMAEQALLPPCAGLPSQQVPPRITPGLGHPTNCRTPNIYERDSEERIKHLLDNPWQGPKQDDYQGSGSNRSYASVPFWYYAQARLRLENTPTDFMHTFWTEHSGNDDIIDDLSEHRFPNGGLGKLYHRFMIDTYLQTIKSPYGDNPYFDVYRDWASWNGPWYVSSAMPSLKLEPGAPNAPSLNTPLHFIGDDGTPNTIIEPMGTRYYVIPAFPTTPPTATLEISFTPKDLNEELYNVTALDMRLDAQGKPLTVTNSLVYDYGTPGKRLQFANFSTHGIASSQRQVIVVVSEVPDYNPLAERTNDGFDLEAQVVLDATRPVAAPAPFSPNDDTRRDETILTAYLNPLPHAGAYEINLGVQDPSILTHIIPLDIGTRQLPDSTYVFTWDGELENLPTESLTYTLVLDTEEVDENGAPMGITRRYTTTAAIDLEPPAHVSNLAFTAGSEGDIDTESVPDKLTWQAPSGDPSLAGGRFLVFAAPLKRHFIDIEQLQPIATLPITMTELELTHQMNHVPRSRWYTVVVEDNAGNRSTRRITPNQLQGGDEQSDPPMVFGDVAKRDVIFFMSGAIKLHYETMPDGSLNLDYREEVLSGTLSLLNSLTPNDRVGVAGDGYTLFN
ncbi:MAG TPA: hypothetical protein VGE07_24135, partial [Herpetosiphonaceae bacterium]